MAPKIEKVAGSFGLTEGPHWDPSTKSLYFIDCYKNQLARYNPATNKVTKASTDPKRPTFIIPVENQPNHFIVSLGRELLIVQWDGESAQFTVAQKLGTAGHSPEVAAHTFNDGKCDSSGRLWTGTMNLNHEDHEKTPAVGTLYSFDPKRGLKGHADQLRLSNGFAFNDQTKKLFFIDSLKKTVDVFDFDVTNGTVSNRQVWFSLEKNRIPGIPDGMTTDTDGNLWVAVFGGSRVLKIDGSKAETLLDTIEMPALQITSVAFGGNKLDELYVTSGPGDDVGNAALFKVTATGSRGLPANNFKLT